MPVCANWPRESLPNFYIQERSNFQAPVLVGVSNDEAPDSGNGTKYPPAKEALVPADGFAVAGDFVVLTGFMGVEIVESPRSCGGPSGGLKMMEQIAEASPCPRARVTGV